jgi:riboflavin kinase/FMN adenylyltransferase
MKIYRDITELQEINKAIVTIGLFDGVHLGHIKILDRLKKIAQKERGETLVITFHPHPRLVLNKENTQINLLNSLSEKIKLLEKAGIDHLLIIPFTEKFSELTPNEFIGKILIEKIHPSHVVVGYNHTFGKNAGGDFIDLRNFAIEKKFQVEEISAQKLGKVSISSSKIRLSLEKGEIEEANAMLGYPYFISGKVIRGQQLGKFLGFPTANIGLEDKNKLIPAKGVYACHVERNGKIYNGMANIGNRPTVNGSSLTIEANIFDFDEDIYYETISIHLIARIRDEKKFGSLDLLKKQLSEDRDKISKMLN